MSQPQQGSSDTHLMLLRGLLFQYRFKSCRIQTVRERMSNIPVHFHNSFVFLSCPPSNPFLAINTGNCCLYCLYLSELQVIVEAAAEMIPSPMLPPKRDIILGYSRAKAGEHQFQQAAGMWVRIGFQTNSLDNYTRVEGSQLITTFKHGQVPLVLCTAAELFSSPLPDLNVYLLRVCSQQMRHWFVSQISPLRFLLPSLCASSTPLSFFPSLLQQHSVKPDCSGKNLKS